MIWELRVDPLNLEMSTRADVIFCLSLALTYWIECEACWELALPAGELWMISSSYCTGCFESNSSSDLLLWHSPQCWVFVESVILIGSSASCFGSLYATHVLVGSLLGSFVGLLIGSTNQNQWFSWTWFPATGLRLVKALALLAKRKIAISTKSFAKAAIASNPFLFIAVQ